MLPVGFFLKIGVKKFVYGFQEENKTLNKLCLFCKALKLTQKIKMSMSATKI